jgi:hypothetical protein
MAHVTSSSSALGNSDQSRESVPNVQNEKSQVQWIFPVPSMRKKECCLVVHLLSERDAHTGGIEHGQQP